MGQKQEPRRSGVPESQLKSALCGLASPSKEAENADTRKQQPRGGGEGDGTGDLRGIQAHMQRVIAPAVARARVCDTERIRARHAIHQIRRPGETVWPGEC